jgi:hypothetical protein
MMSDVPTEPKTQTKHAGHAATAGKARLGEHLWLGGIAIGSTVVSWCRFLSNARLMDPELFKEFCSEFIR